MDKEQVSASPADREAWMKEAERLAHEMQRKYHNAMVWSSRENAEDPPPAKAAWQEYQAARALLLLHISTAAPAVQQDGWMPIETAPKNRKVLVAYKNSLGKWRRVMASYATAADIEVAGEDSGYGDTGAKLGWYEECESQETIMPVEGEPELWHELPPVESAGSAPAEPAPAPAMVMLTEQEVQDAYANVPWLNDGTSSPAWMDRMNAVIRAFATKNGATVGEQHE
jgi:hypothetical protein